ncbi:MAG: hypothetical protein V4726_06685 [Verrucomicrobiota bacterium]
MRCYKPLHPLDSERLSDRIENNFAAAYLTLISIIQGVALYFVLNNSMAIWKNPEGLDKRFLLYPATSFLSLVVVFYLYSYFVSVTFRPPSIRDCLFPMILGALEVIPTFYFDMPKYWWLWYSVFTFFAVVPLMNTWLSLHADHYAESFKDTYRLTQYENYKNISITFISGIIALFAYRLYPIGASIASGTFSDSDWIPLSLCMTLITILLCMTEFGYLSRLLKLYGLHTDSPRTK